MNALTLAEAAALWRGVLAHTTHTIEYVPPDTAWDRIAAADICAAHPYPPYRKSPFDGYALCLNGKERSYEVVATIGAGDHYDEPVLPGQAVRLMTGCAVPHGCQAVVMQESVLRRGNTIELTTIPQPGDNIIPIGEECQSGGVLLPQGTYLTGGAVSVAVAMGNTAIPVYKDVRVLLVTSGRELVMAGEERQYGQIYNSNAYLFQQLLRDEGIRSVAFCHVSDAPERLASEIKRVRELAADADLILSTGGVSVGLYDTMPQLFQHLGARELYRRIAMRPGSASYGGLIERKGGNAVPVLGLSGNPSAAFNAFHLLAVPVLRQLRGEEHGDFPVVSCRLNGNLTKENPVDRFIQGRLSVAQGRPVFTPNHVVTSSALLGLKATNALALRPKHSPPLTEGEEVPVLLLRRI